MSDQTLSPNDCAALLRRAATAVVLTGAGISTAAGIPDFRGPDGLYVQRRYDPVRVFEIAHFRREPRCFYEFSRELLATIKTVTPTFTHGFLARLEQRGRLAGVVTQNIDLLHQQAGSRTLIELHGSYRRAVCLDCGRRFEDLDHAWWETAMDSSPVSPVVLCPACRGLVKPDIVFFGENVQGYAEAEQLIAACDLLLILGSSLEVFPAAHLPGATRAPTLIVTRGEVALSPADHRFFIADDLDAYFRAVAACLETPQSP